MISFLLNCSRHGIYSNSLNAKQSNTLLTFSRIQKWSCEWHFKMFLHIFYPSETVICFSHNIYIELPQEIIFSSAILCVKIDFTYSKLYLKLKICETVMSAKDVRWDKCNCPVASWDVRGGSEGKEYCSIVGIQVKAASSFISTILSGQRTHCDRLMI